ncbi:MAG: hypothetical protein JWN69_1074 [Alphaproteobacteria bacterium]|nr:hypothetical protein [Alphaproteobacteria bacterium]
MQDESLTVSTRGGMADASPLPTRPGRGSLADQGLRSFGVLLLGAVIIAAVAFRLYLVATTDFPLNDGGLFYAFVQAVAKTFPGLPDVASYNDLTMPFAYPPLSFWLGALLTRFGVDPLTVVHIAPFIMNILYVLLFALVLLRSGRSPLFTAITLLFFCVVVRSFVWLVMGGGLSRGLGSIFLMLTMLAITIPGRERGPSLPAWRLALAGAAVGGALLSHLEWGIDAAGCVILSRALGSPNFRDFVRSNLIAGSVASLVIAPWLVFVLSSLGLAPLLAAGGSSEWGLSATVGHLISFVLFSTHNPLVLLGCAILVRRRDFFWPAFALMCMVLTPRHAPTPMILGFAVFFAQAVVSTYDYLLGRLRSQQLAGGVTAMLAAFFVTYQAYNLAVSRTDFTPLARELRDMMGWMKANHPGSASIIVNERRWWVDASAEWFPVLAGARSVNTLQGREWLPKPFGEWVAMDEALKTSASCPELLKAMAAFERPDFIWAETKRECFVAPAFRPVTHNQAVTIFRVADAEDWPPGAVASARRTR